MYVVYGSMCCFLFDVFCTLHTDNSRLNKEHTMYSNVTKNCTTALSNFFLQTKTGRSVQDCLFKIFLVLEGLIEMVLKDNIINITFHLRIIGEKY